MASTGVFQKGAVESHERSRRVLFAVVTEFIETGLPVASATLTRKYGFDLSSATIRNVLSELEESGYLRQPHASAGRVPTELALRVFVQALLVAQRVEPEQIEQLSARFAQIYASAAEPLRETGRLLAELSGAAALVSTPRSEQRALQQLRFIPLRRNREGSGQLLAVLVFGDGSVENRFLEVEQVPTEAELIPVHNLLADIVDRRPLGEIRALCERRLSDQRDEIDGLRRRALELAQQATAQDPAMDSLVIEGQSRLLELPEFAQGDRLRNMLRGLEQREQLLRLLDQTLQAGTATVFVGSEAGEVGAGELSVVVAPYRDGARVAGTVGVIGPTRMDYGKVVAMVDAAAQAVTQALARPRSTGQIPPAPGSSSGSRRDDGR